MKARIDVLKTDEVAQEYWSSQGWKPKADIHRYSFIRAGDENA